MKVLSFRMSVEYGSTRTGKHWFENPDSLRVAVSGSRHGILPEMDGDMEEPSSCRFVMVGKSPLGMICGISAHGMSFEETWKSMMGSLLMVEMWIFPWKDAGPISRVMGWMLRASSSNA